MYDENTDPLLVSRCEKASWVCALSVAALGIAILTGWGLDIAVLKSVRPEWGTMKANAALGFLLAGASLLAAGLRPADPGWRTPHFILAALVTLLGLLTLGEYALAVDLGIDQLLFNAPVEAIGTAPPGRMAGATAVALALTGLALLLLDSRWGRIGSQGAALLGNLIGVLAILGYAYKVPALYGVGGFSSVALPTAIGFVVVNLGVLFARPQRGLMAVVTSRTVGGVMARRLLPLAILAPFIIGWFRIHGEQLGFYSSDFGVALVTLLYVALFSVFIWRTAEALRHTDQRRIVAERERRQQQAQLTGIIDSAMDAIVMVDAAQRVVLFNPAAAQMFGRQAADVLGGPLEVLLPTRFRAAHSGHLRTFGTTGATSRRMGGLGAITGLRASGEEFPIEASISQLDADGQHYFTVILRDITERRAAEEAIGSSKAEAEQANTAKSRFLAAASHDLRQPLAALSLYVNVLRDKVGPADQALLANMKDCVLSLSGLLTDLLDLSKLEAGVVRPNVSDFSVAWALASLESIHTPEAQVKGLQLRCVPSGITARTDPVLFKRMLGNLIDNAIRYTERGGIVVACRRRQGKTWLEVWDTGIGIPADKTAEIFEEFKQLDDGARNRGSGLGLAIVAKTAALLGLEIRVRSRSGRGSMFAIELPLGQQQATPSLLVSDVVHRPLRIALVEDNPMVRQALVSALRGVGHQVIAAATGEELRAELGSLSPDIVVSDYRLARGETGFDVITGVRARMGVDLPAILITGDTDPKLIRSMSNRGIVVVHKPVELETLQAYLEDLTYQAG